jgi:hypothetical protein
MGPSNNHQLTMTIAIDKISAEGRLSRSAVGEVANCLHFTMSQSDREFLVNYISWRMDHPIVKKGSGNREPPVLAAVWRYSCPHSE